MEFGGILGVLVTVTCLVAMSGCAPQQEAAGSPGGGAELRVSPGEVGVGDEVVLTLVNRSDQDLGYNLCPAGFERREGGTWVDEPIRPAEICTMELRVLPPGESDDYRHTVPSGLVDGEYRFRVSIEAPLGEGQVAVTSEAFRVRS